MKVLSTYNNFINKDINFVKIAWMYLSHLTASFMSEHVQEKLFPNLLMVSVSALT